MRTVMTIERFVDPAAIISWVAKEIPHLEKDAQKILLQRKKKADKWLIDIDRIIYNAWKKDRLDVFRSVPKLTVRLKNWSKIEGGLPAELTNAGAAHPGSRHIVYLFIDQIYFMMLLKEGYDPIEIEKTLSHEAVHLLQNSMEQYRQLLIERKKHVLKRNEKITLKRMLSILLFQFSEDIWIEGTARFVSEDPAILTKHGYLDSHSNARRLVLSFNSRLVRTRDAEKIHLLTSETSSSYSIGQHMCETIRLAHGYSWREILEFDFNGYFALYENSVKELNSHFNLRCRPIASLLSGKGTFDYNRISARIRKIKN